MELTIDLSVTGGTGVYIYNIISGQLPAGLRINQQQQEITGTPYAAGDHDLLIRINDNKGQFIEKSLLIKIEDWMSNIVLGQRGDYDFAGIYEFDNLTIDDNVEVTSNGISQLILYVKGTLSIGKNSVIRVRNGYYPDSPQNSIRRLSSLNLQLSGLEVPNKPFRIYPNMFGKGGNGGDGGDGSNPYSFWWYNPCNRGQYYKTQGYPGGGGGGGGYGGGEGGSGGRSSSGLCLLDQCTWAHWGSTGGDGACCGGGSGGHPGCGQVLGQDGSVVADANINIASPGSGNGNGGNSDTYNRGGGGGYGGGVLIIIANDIAFDPLYPPKYLVSGQKGGINTTYGSDAYDGQNGEGGLLVIQSPGYNPSKQHWNLNENTYGTRTYPSINGGHGIQTGNPTSVFVNATKWGETPEPPEIISFDVDTTEGKTPLSVTFNCSAHDPNGHMEFRWDFDGNGTIDEIKTSGPEDFDPEVSAFSLSVDHIYDKEGIYIATCTVKENKDYVSESIPIRVTAGSNE